MDDNSLHIEALEADLIRFINGECTAQESERIYALIADNPDIRQQYNSLSEAATEYDSYYLDKNIDTAKAKAGFFNMINEEETNTIQEPAKTPQLSTLFKVAAAILLLLVPGLYIVINKTQDIELLATNKPVHEVQLPDNSTVWVNANTQLTYPKKFGRKQRAAKLVGEAYFEIESDTENPFYINTPSLQVKVVGTALNIRDYTADSIFSVAVTEGKVEIRKLSGELVSIVTAGSAFNYQKETAKWHVQTLANNNYQAWKTGKLVFRENRLDEVVTKLEEYYRVSINLNPSLNDKEISSTFDNDSLHTVLDIISFIHNLSVHERDSIIYITAKK